MRKLCLFYKIKNNLTPTYLKDIIPKNVGSRSNYNLRNANNISVPSARLRHSYNSFIPSSIRLWNNIPDIERNRPTLQSFKSYIKVVQPVAPSYYAFGIRKFNIIHTKLRYMTSQLNYDLYRFHLKDSPACHCGNECENVHHFLLDCGLYKDQREKLILQLQSVTKCPITINLMLFGNSDLSIKDNELIFSYVQKFICHSNRFQ